METISQLRAWFTALKKPTQAQFWAVFDSFAHKQRDYDNMGGGLKNHNPQRVYKAGEAMIVSGKLRIAKSDLPAGVYDENQWTDFVGDVNSLGIPAWTPEEEFVFDEENLIQRTHRNAIYELIGDNVAIEPGIDPDWETYWTAVVFTEGGIIPVLTSGFVKFNRVYEYTGDLMPKGFYRCLPHEGGYDDGYKLSISQFDADFDAGKWDGPIGGTGSGSGADGLSAYEVAVENGFSGDESEWLASLVGPPGDPGDPGASGNGISSIDQIDPTTLRVTYSDSSTADFILPIGPQGEGVAGVCETISLTEYNLRRVGGTLVPNSKYKVTSAYTCPLIGTAWNVRVTAISGTAIAKDCEVEATGFYGTDFYKAETSDNAFSLVVLREHSQWFPLTLAQVLAYPGAGSAPFTHFSEIYFTQNISGFQVLYRARVNNENTAIMRDGVECLTIHPDFMDFAPGMKGMFDLTTEKFTPYFREIGHFFDGIPGAAQNEAAGYPLGKSRLIDYNTQITWLYNSGLETAVWEPISTKFWKVVLDPADIIAGGPIAIPSLPAPGAGLAWVITECSGQCKFTSLAFDGTPGLSIAAVGTGDGQYYADEGFMVNDADLFGKLIEHSVLSGGIGGNIVENAGMQVVVISPPSEGDSVISIWGQARLIKL